MYTTCLTGARSSAVEHFSDKEGVDSPTLSEPTRFNF